MRYLKDGKVFQMPDWYADSGTDDLVLDSLDDKKFREIVMFWITVGKLKFISDEVSNAAR